MFTICIPTYKRQDKLRRLLYFYEQCNKDFKILIGDSNCLKGFRKNREYIKTLKNYQNIKIFHNPRKGLFTNVIETHRILLENIETKYTVICPDDDIQFPNAILKMCKILDFNDNLIGVNGIGLQYDPINNYYCEYPLRGLEQTTSFERVTSLFENYFGILFTVFRSDKFKFILNNLYEKNEAIKAEYHPGFYSAILGKIKNINEIQLIRPAENQERYKLNNHETINIDDQHTQDFLKILSLEVSKRDHGDFENIKKNFNKSIIKLITKRRKFLFLVKLKNYFYNKKIKSLIENSTDNEINAFRHIFKINTTQN